MAQGIAGRYTIEENVGENLMTGEKRVLAVVNHIQQLLRHERTDCPFCGQHVEALQQVVASVYTCAD
jgi:hypothetical protein